MSEAVINGVTYELVPFELKLSPIYAPYKKIEDRVLLCRMDHGGYYLRRKEQ